MPDAAGAVHVLVVLAINTAELKEQLRFARDMLQSFTNELLGFSRFAKVRSQPIGGGHVRFWSVRVKGGGKLQPRQQLALLARGGICLMVVVATVLMIAVRAMNVALGFGRAVGLFLAEMSVNRGMEVAAKAINPIVRFPALGQVFMMVARSRVGCHVELLLVRPLIKDRGVTAAMKVGVCFYIEVLGKEPAAITQSHGKEVRGTRAAARPRLIPRLEPGHQAQTKHEQ